MIHMTHNHFAPSPHVMLSASFRYLMRVESGQFSTPQPFTHHTTPVTCVASEYHSRWGDGSATASSKVVTCDETGSVSVAGYQGEREGGGKGRKWSKCEGREEVKDKAMGGEGRKWRVRDGEKGGITRGAATASLCAHAQLPTCRADSMRDGFSQRLVHAADLVHSK